MAFRTIQHLPCLQSVNLEYTRSPNLVPYAITLARKRAPAGVLRRKRCDRVSRNCAGEASISADEGVQAEEGINGQAKKEARSPAIPTRLNSVPHPRETRKWFYEDCKEGVLNALAAGERRLQVRVTIPETNPEVDVYRVGTVLEMVREIATALALDGKRVKVCVQGAMGSGSFKGMPLSLSGVSRIMEAMDWGDIRDFVSFGTVEAGQVDEAAYYLLIAPQNVVGGCIMTSLYDMVAEVEEQNKCIVLVNPILKDIPSSSGVMNIRGRKERMEFAASFTAAYHFRLLFMSSSMMYPIMGAIRYRYGLPWEVYRRVDLGKRMEEFQQLGTFDEFPDGAKITDLFSKARRGTTSRW